MEDNKNEILTGKGLLEQVTQAQKAVADRIAVLKADRLRIDEELKDLGCKKVRIPGRPLGAKNKRASKPAEVTA